MKILYFFLLLLFLMACSEDPPISDNTDNSMYPYICTNGMEAIGTFEIDNTEKCLICDSGYTLVDNLCSEESSASDNTDDIMYPYICTNGVEATGTFEIDNTEKCLICDSGYTLVDNLCSEEFSPLDNTDDIRYPYICSNGVEATGTFEIENTQKCSTCDSGYTLVDNLCKDLSVSLSVCTFNIQNLGVSKIGRPAVVKALAESAQECDLLFIQELSQTPPAGSTEGSVIRDYLSAINSESNDTYSMSVSPVSGTGGSAEQYAVFYLSSKVALSSHSLYTDTDGDFARPPHITVFTVANTSFTVINNHIAPGDAVAEIKALSKVVSALSSANNTNVIILGDLNADGSYFNENSDWSDVSLVSTSNYVNLVDNNINTTVAVSSNTYDRILVSPSINSNNYVSNSVSVLNWDSFLEEIKTEGCLESYISNCPTPTDSDAEKEVSDHYPVKVQLKFGCTGSECTVNPNPPPPPPIYNLKISEVGNKYNNTTANDYIVLYNAGTTTQNLQGLYVGRDYKCDPSNGWTQFLGLPDVDMPAGSYYLVSRSSNTISADISTLGAIGSNDYCIVLTSSGSEPSTNSATNIIDYVKLGSLSNGNSKQRGGTCYSSDTDMDTDFTLITSPSTPKNSSSTVCTYPID